MLSQAKLQSIVLTAHIARARTFYQDVLELPLVDTSDGALVFDVGGGDLRVSPVPATAATEHTVLGFAVTDIDEVVSYLHQRGVTFARFAGFTHQANGVVTSPAGSRVAFFRDPDANLLSVVQFAA